MRIPILGTLAKYNQAMSTCLVRALPLSASPRAPLIGLLRIAPVNDATQEFPTLLTTETPHHQRTETWCLRTGTPYHPFDAVVNLTHKSIECPQCTWGLSVGESSPRLHPTLRLWCRLRIDQINDSLPRYRWDGIFPGKLQDNVPVWVPHHNG